jgi:putative transposase
MFTPSARRPTIDFVGGLSEFDDVDTKVFCIDGLSGLPWGRPWITHGVDQKSSFPVGTSMDNKSRSAMSAVSAMVNSIEIKRMADFGPEVAHLIWEAYGYPVGALVDNALYNNFRIISLGADLADVSWAQPFQPKQKRSIEYLNGRTVHDFLEKEPGYRGALDDPDALKAGLKTALLVVGRLKIRYLLWLIGAYSNQPMADGFTPRQKYLESNQLSLRSRVPPDTRRLRLLEMVRFPEKLTWGRGGIRTMGLTYQDVDQYKKWINRAGGSIKVSARVSEKDLTHLYIDIPDSDYVLQIPCLEKDYVAGLTLYQQRLILKMCRQMKKSNPSLPDMYAAREALKKMTEQMRTSGSIRERRISERTGELPATPAAAATTEAIHDLEHECGQLALVEMDESVEGWAMPALI